MRRSDAEAEAQQPARVPAYGTSASGLYRRPAPDRNVIVALHTRAAQTGALRMARLVANALSAPLHGLFVWSAPISAHDVPRLTQLPEEEFRGLVLDVEVGDPAERLVARARAQPGSLLVVSAPSTQQDILGLGPIAARALAESPAGVIVVREDTQVPDRLARVLVPLDGTPTTAGSIGPAGELAAMAGAAIDIVYVGAVGHRSIPPEDAEPGSMHAPRYVDQPQHEWSAFSEEFLDRFLGAIAHCPPDVPTRMFLGAGHPSAEILRYANELGSDLIVLVWHGELDEQHGEVFGMVVRAAPCPVLVLKR